MNHEPTRAACPLFSHETRAPDGPLQRVLLATLTAIAFLAAGVEPSGAQAPRHPGLVYSPAGVPRHVTPLPQVRPAGPLVPTTPRALPAAGGSWQIVPIAPSVGLCNPLLLTDGTVMVHHCNSAAWYKLTPDNTGSYIHGTWSPLASLPVVGATQYAPQYHASAVLGDGRVIIAGGEYNGSSTEVWTNLGAIYDPVANAWTAVSPPSGWNEIGDAASVVLQNGTFMLGGCCLFPDGNALLNPATLTWTATGAPVDGAGYHYQDEQGYTLLPNGNVLTIDVWTNYPAGGATNAEQYAPSSGTWTGAGSTPVSLPDPAQCGNWEIGPAVLRPDGTVVAFGGNSGCASLVTSLGASAAADPTAIYNTVTNSWAAGPNVPAVCVATTAFPTTNCTLADAPAAVLPNGNILFAASAGYGQPTTHFFEFTTANTVSQVADTAYFASSNSAFYYNFLVLPTGQILATDFSNAPEVYTPTGTANPSWAPAIVAAFAPTVVNPGTTYSLSGTQFNGLSQGTNYGDDVQAATNYPLVQITNLTTSHVFYARTTGFNNSTSCGLSPNAACFTYFSVPAGIETGPSRLVVIANGISSAALGITVTTGLAPPAAPTGLTATAGYGQVTLQWTASAGATSYTIYVGTSPFGESLTPVKTGVTGTSVTLGNLVAGTKYYFFVQAVGTGGSGGGSQEVSSTVLGTAGSGDGPLPIWALGALGAGLLGAASRRLRA